MFEYCGIIDLVIPEKVTFIGNAFFGNSTLETITIKNSKVDFDELTLSFIPESVKAIYVHADLVDSFKSEFPDYKDKFFAIS